MLSENSNLLQPSKCLRLFKFWRLNPQNLQVPPRSLVMCRVFPSFWNEMIPCWQINGTDKKLTTLSVSSTWCWTTPCNHLLSQWLTFCSSFFSDNFSDDTLNNSGLIDKVHLLLYLRRLSILTILSGRKWVIIGTKTLPILACSSYEWMGS